MGVGEQAQNDAAPGWDAITAEFERIYPGQQPKHWASALPSRVALGGNEVMDGCSCYLASSADGAMHWHFVTYGLSELYYKESPNAEVNGFGLEFTFRLKCEKGEAWPPMWPISLLGNLARHVYQSGNVFADGDHMSLNGPIALDRQTDIHAAIFTVDPDAGKIRTVHGWLTFIQVVGITLDELNATRKWDSGGMLDLMRRANGRLVTDLARPSLLSDSEMLTQIQEGIRRDGSSSSALRVDALNAQAIEGADGERSLRVTVRAGYVDMFQTLLRGRTMFGRPFCLYGKDVEIYFTPDSVFGWSGLKKGNFEVKLTGEQAEKLAETVRPLRGEYFFKELGLVVGVEPTEIRDDGGKVSKVVG